MPFSEKNIPEIPEIPVEETEDGEVIFRRVMTPAMILERDQLNIENTAEMIKARATAARAAQNGREGA